jgi:Transcriptional regulatory protein, C terminal/Bacterial transcriptional activator domain
VPNYGATCRRTCQHAGVTTTGTTSTGEGTRHGGTQPLLFSVLGPLSVTSARGAVDLGGPRQRLLLALLLAHPNQDVSTSDLLAGVWWDRPPRGARRTLLVHVSRLRAVLEPDPGRGGEPSVLLRTAAGYRLRVTPDQLDSLAFRRAVTTARRQLAVGEVAGGVRQLTIALTRWRGPAFADLRHHACLAAAAAELDRLRSDAAAELARVQRSTAPARSADAPPHGRAETEATVSPAGSDRAGGSERHPHLHGREDALALLREAWAATQDGAGQVVIVTGPAGIGRTRLLREFGDEVRVAGSQVTTVDARVGHVALDAEGETDARLVLVDDLDPSTHPSSGTWPVLLETTRDRPVMVVLAVTDDGSTPRLQQVLDVLDPDGARTVRLPPLGPEHLVRMAATYVGPAHAGQAAAAVTDHAAGLPSRVHRELAAWARDLDREAVRATLSAAAADRSRAGQAESRLAAALGDLMAVDAHVPEGPAPVDAGSCPYPGLAPFTAAAFFVGREQLVADVTARLAVAGTVTLVGAPGVGATSLVLAGVLPLLAGDALPGSERWRVVRTTPHAAADVDTVRGGPETVVVLDPLEDLLGLDPADRDRLVGRLAALRGNGTRLVLVAGADRYAALADVGGLGDLLGSAVHIPPMTDTQLAATVDEPVRRAGGWCEAGLAKVVVADIGGPAALPLLSTAMRELWRSSPDGGLTLRAYAETGGARQSIARLGETCYGRLDAPEQAAARSLLSRMAVGPVPLRAVPGMGAERAALDRLVAGGLVTVVDGQAVAAHDALFSCWPRLAGWLAVEGEEQAALRRLADATRAWDAGGRQQADLLRGPILAAATELAGQHPDLLAPEEVALAYASRTAEQREHAVLLRRVRRQHTATRWLTAALAVCLVLLVVAVVVAVVAVAAQRR